MPQTADEQTRALLDEINGSGAPKLYELPIEVAREALIQSTKPLEIARCEVRDVKDKKISYEGGSFTIRVYSPPYEPTGHNVDKLPALIMSHGGGFILGNIDGHDPIARYLCVHSGQKVISIDYRLAPEFKYPTGLHDCLYATEWVFENADDLGIDVKKISLIGDSAGANLSAGIIQLSNRTFKSLILLYPCVDMTVDAPYSSRELYGGGDYFLSKGDMTWILQQYAPDNDPSLDSLLSPIQCHDFSNWPRTLVVTAGMDILRDEAYIFSRKLTSAGVDCEYISYEGTIHGFVSFAGAITKGKDCMDKACEFLKQN